MIKDHDLSKIDVLILCGGLGKRLKKVSGNTPKSMVKIGKRVFLDIVIEYLAGFGFRRFILGTGYKAGIIEKYYLKKSIKSFNILFSREKAPLGTGGAVKNALNLIKSGCFFILNGDSFCRFDPVKFLGFHQKKKSLVSILLRNVSKGKDYGEVKINKDSRIMSFNEKKPDARKALINAGVYIFTKRAIKSMPENRKFSLERDFFPILSGKDIFGYEKSDFFIDIGTPERYLKAKRLLIKNG